MPDAREVMKRPVLHRWLFIDTSQKGTFRSGMIGPGAVRVRRGRGRASGLLRHLENLRMSVISCADGICVVVGPGSFSAVRVGVLVANVLARWWKKPLVGIEVHEAENIKQLVDDLDQGRKIPQSFVEPRYDAEPNITIAKTSV